MSEAAHNSEGLVFHPMDQFIVRPLFGDDGIVGPPYGPKGEREVLVNAIGPDGPPRS